MDSRALKEPGAADPFLQKVKYSVFGVFHSMTDKTASKHPSERSQMLQLAVMLFDFVQAAGLLIHADFGWQKDVLAWTDKVNLLSSLLPETNPTLSSLVRAGCDALGMRCATASFSGV